jgi:outer membrane protein assembly factor BamB/HEAT repeat protein
MFQGGMARVGSCFLSACIAVSPLLAFPQESRSLPTESELLAKPGLASTWSDRLLADARKTREKAAEELIHGGAESLPLLRHFLLSGDERLRKETFEIIRRVGAGALPLLIELLGWNDVSIQREAVSVMIDLAPDTETAQPALVRALNEEDQRVARDAARALGALGERASSSVPSLVKALSHRDPGVRSYVAEALASIGPAAAPATPDLTKALRDLVPGVRWAAGEALAAIGPKAAPAIPELIEALQDEFLYVRICAAGALGSIGLNTEAALAALKEAENDPAMRAEAEWARHQIAGLAPGADAASSAQSEEGGNTAAAALLGHVTRGTPEAAEGKGRPPEDWDIKTGRNIVWSVGLGNETFGRPVVSGGVVYVGTDNGRKRIQACQGECGVLLAFRATDGALLWQDAAPRVNRGTGDFLLPSTTGGPHVEGDRVYYVTAECQLRSLDTQGFRDGENDGPFRDEQPRDERAADLVWELDMRERLGVFPHEASNSDVLAIGDLLIVATSNGRNEGHTRVPSPQAPSVIAVDKRSGDVVWRAVGPGANVLHGQWSSPALANVNGRPQVLFGGGDGWLRAYDAESGRELWRFDGNPAEAKWLPRPGVSSRSSIIATPVYGDGRVFIAMGQDPSHGDGPSVLHAVSPNGQGDVTRSRSLWSYRGIGRVVGTPVLQDGLLYVGDLGGVVHCLDAATGAVVWTHKTDAPIWGCLLAANDRLYVGNTDGVLHVLRTGRRKKELARIEMDAALYSRPALVGDTLYLVTAGRLYVIKASASQPSLDVSRNDPEPGRRVEGPPYFAMTASPVAISSVHSFGSGSRSLPSPISTGIQR